MRKSHCGNIAFHVGLPVVLVIFLGLGLWQPFSCLGESSGLIAAQSPIAAPDFELPDLNGQKIRLKQYRGQRPVLLYFWATWCPACRAAKPDLIKLRNRTRESELEILAINVGSGDSLERLKLYQKGHPMPFKILYDQGSRVTQTYRVQGIPLFVLVNNDGDIVYRAHRMPEEFWKYLEKK